MPHVAYVYTCHICGFSSKRRKPLVRHVESQHCVNYPLYVALCDLGLENIPVCAHPNCDKDSQYAFDRWHFNLYCSDSCRKSHIVLKYLEDPSNRQEVSARQSAWMRSLNRSEEQRERTRAQMIRQNADPDFKRKASLTSSNKLRELQKRNVEFMRSHGGQTKYEFALWSHPDFQSMNPLWRDTRYFHSCRGGGYVLDFTIPNLMLNIELDGMSHKMGNNSEKDRLRDEFLRSQGWTILRIKNEDVERDIDSVIALIRTMSTENLTNTI